MLYKNRNAGSWLIAIMMSLLLAIQPVHARHEIRVLGIVIATLVTGGYLGIRYFSDDFDLYNRDYRSYSDNLDSPAVGSEKYYSPNRKIIGYTLSDNSLEPHVTRIRQVEFWSAFKSSINNKKTRIGQLQKHIDMDYQHWKRVHKNKPEKHFERYIANLAAYCETGGLPGGYILAFHAPTDDMINFRNTCRMWLDNTIDKTDLLVGSNTNAPVVLAPIWKFNKTELKSTPQVSFILNPYFQQDGSASLYDESPAKLYIQGPGAQEFKLFPVVSLHYQFMPVQLFRYPRPTKPGQVLDNGILFTDFSTHKNMSVPYILGSSQGVDRFLIFRQSHKLEIWALYSSWFTEQYPLKVIETDGQFSVTLYKPNDTKP